jgi:hypothetical protein
VLTGEGHYSIGLFSRCSTRPDLGFNYHPPPRILHCGLVWPRLAIVTLSIARMSKRLCAMITRLNGIGRIGCSERAESGPLLGEQKARH